MGSELREILRRRIRCVGRLERLDHLPYNLPSYESSGQRWFHERSAFDLFRWRRTLRGGVSHLERSRTLEGSASSAGAD